MIFTKYIVIGAAVAGFLSGSVAGGFGSKLVYDHIVIPKIEKTAEKEKTEAVNTAKQRCEEQITAATAVASETAKSAEYEHLMKMYEGILAKYRSTLSSYQSEIDQFKANQERKDKEYAESISSSGHSCPLTSGDIDYLTKLHD